MVVIKRHHSVPNIHKILSCRPMVGDIVYPCNHHCDHIRELTVIVGFSIHALDAPDRQILYCCRKNLICVNCIWNMKRMVRTLLSPFIIVAIVMMSSWVVVRSTSDGEKEKSWKNNQQFHFISWFSSVGWIYKLFHPLILYLEILIFSLYLLLLPRYLSLYLSLSLSAPNVSFFDVNYVIPTYVRAT